MVHPHKALVIQYSWHISCHCCITVLYCQYIEKTPILCPHVKVSGQLHYLNEAPLVTLTNDIGTAVVVNIRSHACWNLTLK